MDMYVLIIFVLVLSILFFVYSNPQSQHAPPLFTERSCKFDASGFDPSRFIKFYELKNSHDAISIFKTYRLHRNLKEFYDKIMKLHQDKITAIILGFRSGNNNEICKLYLFESSQSVHYGKELGNMTNRKYVNVICDEKKIKTYAPIIHEIYPNLNGRPGHIRYDDDKEVALYVKVYFMKSTIKKESLKLKKILTHMGCTTQGFDSWVHKNGNEILTYFGMHKNKSVTFYHSSHLHFTQYIDCKFVS